MRNRSVGILSSYAKVVLVALPLGACATAAEQQAQARAIAANDDATCRSYGAKPGSAVYVQCRMNLSNQRVAAERQEEADQTALGAAWLLSRH